MNACLTSLTLLYHSTYASMHDHINACSLYIIAKKKIIIKKKEETLIQHVKGKQTIKQKKKGLKNIKKKGQNRGLLCERNKEAEV